MWLSKFSLVETINAIVVSSLKSKRFVLYIYYTKFFIYVSFSSSLPEKYLFPWVDVVNLNRYDRKLYETFQINRGKLKYLKHFIRKRVNVSM